jgi:pentatricopeptide repeat protein
MYGPCRCCCLLPAAACCCLPLSAAWCCCLVLLLQRVDPEVRTYTLVMLACNTAEQYHHTLRLFQEMTGCGKPPNTGTYNAVILACCKWVPRGEAGRGVAGQMMSTGTPSQVRRTRCQPRAL